jgi:hypothetical protein
MAIKTDNELDQEIQSYKARLRNLQLKVQTFMVNHSRLEPKERTKTLLEIQRGFQSFSRFFDKATAANVKNVGTRFAADNLKQSYQSLFARWRKFEGSEDIF